MTQQKTPLEPKNTRQTQPASNGAPRTSAPKQSAFREKLRGWIAQLQCSMVRVRHHARKKTRAQQKRSLRKLQEFRLYRAIGDGLYLLGFEGEYAAVCGARACREGALQIWRRLCRAGRRIGHGVGLVVRTVAQDVLRPIAVFVRGIWHMLRHANAVRKDVGLPRAIWAGLCYLGRGIRLYARLLPRAIAYVVPVAVAVVCFTFVHGRLSEQYALAVQVTGKGGTAQTVGYVKSESVFESAKADVNERINYAGTSQTSWNLEASYTLATMQDASPVMDESQMADAILEASSDEIAEGTAIYIDGVLCRVTTDGDKVAQLLADWKAPYEAAADADTVVQFNHAVELVDGVFFTDSFSSYDDVVNYLSSDQIKEQEYTVTAGDSISLIASKNGLTQSELFALNTDIGLNADSALFPGDKLVVQKQEKVLEVQTVQTITYTEAIPYDTVTTESDEYAYGTTKTVQEGQDGVSQVTAQITRDANGIELSTVILSRETIQEPVTKQVVRGTKLPSGSVAQLGSGTLIWPVPGYRYCSRWMSSGHKGVDICAAAGTPIYASDSGVVVKAGYNAAGSGYGNSVVIDHGNGIRTLYAHCLSLNVSVGQSVSQGQLIGTVGSTGRSTGNHCHFEIIKNGVRVAPQSLFSK